MPIPPWTHSRYMGVRLPFCTRRSIPIAVIEPVWSGKLRRYTRGIQVRSPTPKASTRQGIRGELKLSRGGGNPPLPRVRRVGSPTLALEWTGRRGKERVSYLLRPCQRWKRLARGRCLIGMSIKGDTTRSVATDESEYKEW